VIVLLVAVERKSIFNFLTMMVTIESVGNTQRSLPQAMRWAG
jgi:hypothetical protein